MQREAPADAAGGQVAVALKDEEGDIVLLEVLGKDEAAYAGAYDQDRRRGRRHGCAGEGQAGVGNCRTMERRTECERGR